ncbi:PhzF family phenazine biosynthesis protein [Catellatospora citrea]|uniref:PhzF family phenazine biosynthesis protein n=1 Tax=Catellatospora citrea TaxID=53366 RepID=UPI0019431BEC|nr:PhzF family phenazine biosynthesis protein [Catellatospora citrea]
MVDLHVLRVFCGPGGRGGNRLGVVGHGGMVIGERLRLAVAAKLGFSETVFVDDPARGVVDIYTPSVRLPCRTAAGTHPRHGPRHPAGRRVADPGAPTA